MDDELTPTENTNQADEVTALNDDVQYIDSSH